MGGRRFRLLISVLAVAALAAGVTGQAAALTLVQPYEDPTWAPDWFKLCTNPKQWVEFNVAASGGSWSYNYTPANPLAEPTATLIFNSTVPVGVTVWMDNTPQPDYYKQVWADVVFAGLGPFTVDDPVLQWNSWSVALSRVLTPVGPGNPGYYVEDYGVAARVTLYWEIFPQPDWERVTLKWSPPAQLQWFRMATQCNPIPEPVFFQMGALLGLSGLGMLKLRRR